VDTRTDSACTSPLRSERPSTITLPLLAGPPMGLGHYGHTGIDPELRRKQIDSDDDVGERTEVAVLTRSRFGRRHLDLHC
jgi:hypothetical protein